MKYLIALVVFVFAGTASAQIPHVVPSGTRDKFLFKSGNDLLRMCQGNSSGRPSEESCLGYITGVVDLIAVQQGHKGTSDDKVLWKFTAICLPDGVDTGQIRDVVVKYLVENPAQRDHNAASLIIPALIAAWGCPAK